MKLDGSPDERTLSSPEWKSPRSMSNELGRTSSLNAENSVTARRSDLDALRAVAMLLGIFLHAALSFFPSLWMVTDQRQDSSFAILFSAIHGFRMPLFFVMCGFFSAMLLHKRGRRALVKHRFQRVFLPLVAGMLTVIPLTVGISNFAMSSAAKKASGAPPAIGASTIWAAAHAGDLGAIERHLASGVAVDAPDPGRGGTPLMWAAIAGRAEAVELLIKRGADVNFAGQDGGTALHGAAFLGHEKVVESLLKGGAKSSVANKSGSTPLDTAVLDVDTTIYYAALLQLDVNKDGLGRRKAAIAETLREHGATAGRKTGVETGVTDRLMQTPVFNHLWFLWFLWWLVLGYAAVSAIGARLSSIRLPAWLILSPARYLWLVPLTMIPQWFTGDGGAAPIFGPDTSTGLLPIPHVFAYYAIFFGFGVLYFNFDDRYGRVGERWWLPLAIGLLMILPLGLGFADGWIKSLGVGPGSLPNRMLPAFFSATYAWLMTFGLMGLFRRVCPVENPSMRYLSDSAYWLYLAHLPLIIGAQHLVRDWAVPAVVKFILIVAVVTAFLVWVYQVMVRYTLLGRFLNGPRVRPTRVSAAEV